MSNGIIRWNCISRHFHSTTIILDSGQEFLQTHTMPQHPTSTLLLPLKNTSKKQLSFKPTKTGKSVWGWVGLDTDWPSNFLYLRSMHRCTLQSHFYNIHWDFCLWMWLYSILPLHRRWPLGNKLGFLWVPDTLLPEMCFLSFLWKEMRQTELGVTS